MAELKNEFSWSKSRDDTFRTCPRQYCFQYYGSWGGWEATAPERTRRLYVLKQLKTRAMWAGERVHACIEHTLKNLQRGIDVLDPQRITEVTLAEMRNDFRSSRSGRYREKPKTCGLFEHEYRLPVTREQWQQTAETVKTCLHHFYTSDLFAQLRNLGRESWLEVEDFSHFTLDGLKVWAVIDCSFREGGTVFIYDWKTGRNIAEESTVQLKCYGLYATETWGVRIDNVRVAEYYLLVDQVQEHPIAAGDITDAKATIQGSAADMRSLLANPEANEPLAESAFLKTENERVCRRCNFVGVCRPEVARSLSEGRGSGDVN